MAITRIQCFTDKVGAGVRKVVHAVSTLRMVLACAQQATPTVSVDKPLPPLPSRDIPGSLGHSHRFNSDPSSTSLEQA
jgi:hypothetical protein